MHNALQHISSTALPENLHSIGKNISPLVKFKVNYNTDAFILLPPSLTTYYFPYNHHKCHTMTLLKDRPIIHYDTNICIIITWGNSVIKKEENLFPCNLFCTEIWKKTHDYKIHDKILSTKHNSILGINWLFLTQCQQPLFFCIILLEVADDFEKS